MNLLKFSIISSLIFSLVACKKDMTDLDTYFKDAQSIPSQQIEQLPLINSPEIFIYQAEDIRDPFSNDLQAIVETDIDKQVVIEGEGPDLNRRKEMLENYPLDALYMVGTYLQEEDFWGLIEGPEGGITRVLKGQHLGQNYGEIVQVSEDQIDVLEWVSDGLGGWTKREASIALREE